MTQIAQNLTAEFLKILADMGVQSVNFRHDRPNLNAHAERFVRTIKESCLDRMILCGESSPRSAIHEFRWERNHQELKNRLFMVPESAMGILQRSIRRRSRLDGMRNYDYRRAA